MRKKKGVVVVSKVAWAVGSGTLQEWTYPSRFLVPRLLLLQLYGFALLVTGQDARCMTCTGVA